MTPYQDSVARMLWSTATSAAGQMQRPSLPRVPREEIEACRTPAGGYSFTRERLASWGVPWPPPAGWRRALEHGTGSSAASTERTTPS